jgi:hypothetical protein
MAAAVRTTWPKEGSVTYTFTSTPVAHDFLVGINCNDAGNTQATWPTGFNTVGTQQYSSFDGSLMEIRAKNDASGSEGGITVTQAGNNIAGFLLACSGVDNTNPFSVASTTGLFNSSGVASPWSGSASITPAHDGCLILVFVDHDINSGSAVTTTISTTSGLPATASWNKEVEYHSTDASGFINFAVFSAVQVTAGPVTVQVTGTSVGHSAAMPYHIMALKPAGGGGATGLPPGKIYISRQAVNRAGTY